MSVEASPLGDTRARSVPCSVCRTPTFNHSAKCDLHLARRLVLEFTLRTSETAGRLQVSKAVAELNLAHVSVHSYRLVDGSAVAVTAVVDVADWRTWEARDRVGTLGDVVGAAVEDWLTGNSAVRVVSVLTGEIGR